MNAPWQPRTAALELTTACPCRCTTCGSRAGLARPAELSTEEWLSVVRTLRTLGCTRVCLMGGEPFLRPGWRRIAEASRNCGMDVDLITCGIGLSDTTVAALCEVAVTGVTVSVDGTAEAHDRQRRVRGGYAETLDAIRRLDQAGLRVGVTTQINALSLPTLSALASELQAAGALAWQLQLTLPQGRASGQRELVLGAERMPELHRMLRVLHRRRGLRPFITDNIGYCTPDDAELRSTPGLPPRTWIGCTAGLRTIGIRSDGSVKGCLALPDRLIEGNVRTEPLERLWLDPGRFAYSRAFDPRSLGGRCAQCRYGLFCRGGCTAASLAFHATTGISSHCLRRQGATS